MDGPRFAVQQSSAVVLLGMVSCDSRGGASGQREARKVSRPFLGLIRSSQEQINYRTGALIDSTHQDGLIGQICQS